MIKKFNKHKDTVQLEQKLIEVGECFGWKN